MDLLVFPQTYQQLQGTLKPDAALLIKGRVRIEENAKTKVVVSEAKPLETAGNGLKTELVIRINADSAAPAVLGEIERVLAAAPGENPVVFEVTRAGDFQARLRPRSARTVRANSKLLARLRELCGAEPVLVQRNGGREADAVRKGAGGLSRN